MLCFLSQAAERASVDKLEALGFTFNSTNMAHFAYGFTANAVSVLLFGSAFVPVKRTETGDGEHSHVFTD